MMVFDRRRPLLMVIPLVLASSLAARAEERCLYGDCENGYGTREIGDGRISRGTWEQGVRHGYGHEETAAGDEIWQGQFSNGSLNGQAFFISVQERFASSYYVGGWRNGRRHGYGVYVFANGDRYSGEFFDGAWQGQGEYVGSRGDHYAGGFANNRYDGVGTLTVPGVLRYAGSWKAGLRHGEGEESFFDGIFVYRGGYQEDRPSGTGSVWMDGREIHRGSIDPREGYGFGIRTDESELFYVGELHDGLSHGRGAQRMQGGDVRTGLWVNGTLRDEVAPVPTPAAEAAGATGRVPATPATR